MPLYAIFIDFTKAFYAISRDGLWLVLKKFGCTNRIVKLSQALHNGMQAQVMQNNTCSDSFIVTNGVKQRCVLASTLFSLYLTVMLEVVSKKQPRRGVHKGIMRICSESLIPRLRPVPPCTSSGS